MNYRLFFCVIITFSAINLTNAQGNLKCGTHVKSMNPSFQKMLQTPANECNYILQARKKFQITAHIASDSLQPPITSLAQINEAIAVLNAAFEPNDMSFEVCEENNMADFHFYEWNQADDQAYAFIYHYIPNTINIYFVSTVETIDDGEVGGYAFFPGGPEAIVVAVDDDGTVPITTVVHEMGHFFGLFHTFETDFGVENISQDNCATAGDLICDTEADPQGSVDDECTYESPLGNGDDFYTPPIDNWMSYYTSCACRFTIQQYNQMTENYLNSNRFNLW